MHQHIPDLARVAERPEEEIVHHGERKGLVREISPARDGQPIELEPARAVRVEVRVDVVHRQWAAEEADLGLVHATKEAANPFLPLQQR